MNQFLLREEEARDRPTEGERALARVLPSHCFQIERWTSFRDRSALSGINGLHVNICFRLSTELATLFDGKCQASAGLAFYPTV
jgi:hypothetical protein